MASGSYQLVEVVDGSPGSYVDGPALTVAAARVDAAVAVVGRSAGVVRVRVSNAGNAAAVGVLTVTVTAGGAAVASAVRLRPGGSTVVAVRLTAPPAADKRATAGPVGG